MHTLKLTQIGNSVGVILPKEVLARLKVGKGDSLFVTDLPDGVAPRGLMAYTSGTTGLPKGVKRLPRVLTGRFRWRAGCASAASCTAA